MTEKPEITDSNQRTAPGSTVGFIILATLITFVAYWMFVQGRQAQQPETSVSVLEPIALDGFRLDLWQLPDDPRLGFVEIPAGSFLMGSNPAFDRQAYENERWSETQRQGRVELPLFYIGRFEVTVAQYKAFIDASGHPVVEQTLEAQAEHPVTGITWTDALAYCRWLESNLVSSTTVPAEIRTLIEQGWHISLPSEAQWEKAARGSQGAIYPWGSRLQEGRANFAGTDTVAVGSYDCPDCQFSLADMSGNVWELTSSPFQPYPFDPDDERASLSEDALWVMRGGSFADGPQNIRAAVRGGVDPGVRNNTIGFRLVLSP
ncbi:MAG: SUMF1/EgtB/PvdO family nonheme iron enzyme [Gammaproteobacteria bacterium]|nr:SUMF1/EgtB/PvdO family nonheme iron enzyme [Gammaproteobacteria bacterium]